MSACAKIDPEQARQVIECMLDEDAQKLMDLLVSFIESTLLSGTPMALLAARALIAERPDHTSVATPLGQSLIDLNRVDLLQKAADVILVDLRNELSAPRAGREAGHAKVN
ncbi:MAG: hypothetical protein ABSA41_17090 [Terriglobia bacterium]|jgi:hypothetical protein